MNPCVKTEPATEFEAEDVVDRYGPAVLRIMWGASEAAALKYMDEMAPERKKILVEKMRVLLSNYGVHCSPHQEEPSRHAP